MKNNLQKVLALGLMGAASVSQAAVDISKEVGETKTDIATAGALILGVVVAIAAFSWIRRVIK